MPRLSSLVTLITLACSGGARPVTAPAPAAPPPPPPGPFRLVEPPGGPGAGEKLPAVSARVFALGDSQLRHLYGKRGFAQSPFADRYGGIEVAIRPAALDDGGDLLLETFLREHAARYATHTLVYMGDAADLSCVPELDRFYGVMGDDPLLIVTSNHDGFYAGNYTSKADADGALEYTDMPEDWKRACAEPGRTDDRRLTKGRAVRRFAQSLPEGPAWATHMQAEAVDDPSGYKKSWLAYARPLGGGDPGVPGAWGMFVDTVDYRDYDLSSSKGAGTVGVISRAQLDALDRAMFEADHEAGEPAPSWIMFGHHTLGELDRASRERLLKFVDARPRILAYVSAHTHFSDERKHELASGRPFPEIVVGSTTDFGGVGAPQAARLIELRWDPATGARGVASQRLELDLDALCGEVKAFDVADPLGYVGYRINRDDTPDVPTATWDLFWTWLEDPDLVRYRVAQTAGALLVENKLVRALAHLYREAPGELADDDARELDGIIANIVPRLPEEAEPSAWDLWIDPALAERVPSLARGLHSFGGHALLFERLRGTRTTTDARRRWFTCHAARAAEAEAVQRSRRQTKNNVWRIR